MVGIEVGQLVVAFGVVGVSAWASFWLGRLSADVLVRGSRAERVRRRSVTKRDGRP